MDLEKPLEAAVAAARAAGAILLADFHRLGGARGGGDKAAADLEAESLIRERLLSSFSSWAYLGEETGRGEGARGAPIWVVDPNDGTRDYLAGRRGSAVSIALLVDRTPVLGVVFSFAYPDDQGDLFAWADGRGALLRNGRPVQAPLPTELGPQDVVLVSSKGDLDPDGNLRCVEPARYRSLPSIAHRLALVAAGEAAGASALLSPTSWDYAAGHALLRGVGGVVVDESGREMAYDEDGASRCQRACAGSTAVARALASAPWEALRPRETGREALVTPRPGMAIADSGLLSRAQGCLLGQVAGDNLGALVEFSTSREVGRRYTTGPRLLEDGGYWQTLAGQPTDDSEMALALARAIVDRGTYEPEAALQAYRHWYESNPFDVGHTTRAALVGYIMGDSQANGSLMRGSPLGVFAHALDPMEAAEQARADSALTHTHPVCRDSLAAFVVAVGHAVRFGDGPEAAYRAALDWAQGAAAHPSVVEALHAAWEAPPACDGEYPGFVLVGLQNAFFELLHAPSLEEGVVATVRRGGDTDTNAAIAGALLGAVHGREGVPAQWRRMILSCRPHPLRARHPRPMTFWPVDVLELAEALLIAGSAAAGPEAA
jgi:ADP-ribosylglycohydrolase/fructose-1,6-bisphosphatase/inositol monophosphatase family enzyme